VTEIAKKGLETRVSSLDEQSRVLCTDNAEKTELIVRLQQELMSVREENKMLKDENAKRYDEA
jgi:hypothetical protein